MWLSSCFFKLVCLNLESPVVVLYSAASEQERLWDVLSEKRNQIRILSRQDESKRKKVKEAEIKVSILFHPRMNKRQTKFLK